MPQVGNSDRVPETFAAPAVIAALPAAEQCLLRCAALAELSALEQGICRVYLSPEHKQANAQTAVWLREAGCEVWEDAVGNICGRYAAATAAAPTLILGSHLDTIPDAGAYDGVLGVLLAIAVVAALNERQQRLPFHVEIIGFAEEEGVRFGATLITSRAVAGQWDDAWWQLTDAAGVSLSEAFSAFGLDPSRVADAARAPAGLLGFYEVHIEQGPVLEAQGLPLGTVTGIAGNRRLRARIEGQAGHAGTTPMPLRRDAGVAAALAVAELEALARRSGIMATVGQMTFAPGGVNVIPGSADFTVDIRAQDDASRDAALAEFRATLDALCGERSLTFTLDEFHSAPAMHCAPWLMQASDRALAALGHPPQRLPSGAGHDAMALAELCDSGMLFLRCTNGISHHPDEAVTLGDVAWAFAALEQTLVEIAADPLRWS